MGYSNMVNEVFPGILRHRIPVGILIILCVLIVIWQHSLYQNGLNSTLPGWRYARSDATGLNHVAGSSFIYFYYYLGLYPVWANPDNLIYSKEGAKSVLTDPSIPLQTDHSSYILWGEQGKTLLMLFDAIAHSSPKHTSVRLFSFIFFSASLILLLVVTYFSGYRVYGLLMVLLMGSNPFLLYELYGRENIFGIAGALLIFSFALMFPLIVSKKRVNKYYLTISTLTLGIVFAFISHVRSEALVIILSCLLIYAFSPSLTKQQKLLGIVMIIFSTYFVSAIFYSYFIAKYQFTINYLNQIGRNPNSGPGSIGSYHAFWHPVYLGLSDFDNKYGIKWDDNAGYLTAEKYLYEHYPWKFYRLVNREYWSTQEEYSQYIQSKVLGMIFSDPLWYINIIYNRMKAMFTNTVPLGLSFNSSFYAIPFSSLFLFLPLFYFLIIKDVRKLLILLFSFSISLPIILIHSMRNITSISVFQIFAFALIISEVINIIQGLWKGRVSNEVSRLW